MSRAREIADLGSPAASGLSNINLALNGAMNVAQRGDVTGLTAVSYGGPDRYRLALNDLGTYSITQSSTSPDGFSNSFKVDCTTADTSVAAGSYVILQQKIEAQNLQHLLYGSSSAKRTVISFWVRSNLTGTYPFNIYVGDSARQITETYTIDTANTWEQKKIEIDAETVGAINDDNGNGVDLSWFLAAGSTYTGGSATGWNAYSANPTSYGKGITVNMSSSTSNEWYLTGVQWEIGDVATPFEHEDFGTTLAKCQRYYFRQNYDTNIPYLGAGGVYRNTLAMLVMHLPVAMRAAPTAIDQSGTAAHYGSWGNEATTACSAVPVIRAGDSKTSVNVDLTFNTLNSATGTYIYRITNTSGYLGVSAEL